MTRKANSTNNKSSHRPSSSYNKGSTSRQSTSSRSGTHRQQPRDDEGRFESSDNRSRSYQDDDPQRGNMGRFTSSDDEEDERRSYRTSDRDDDRYSSDIMHNEQRYRGMSRPQSSYEENYNRNRSPRGSYQEEDEQQRDNMGRFASYRDDDEPEWRNPDRDNDNGRPYPPDLQYNEGRDRINQNRGRNTQRY